MKKTLFAKVFTVLSMVACVGLMSCGQKKADDANAEEGPAKPKVLVIYYSQTGATKTLAEEVQKQLGADIEELHARYLMKVISRQLSSVVRRRWQMVSILP